MVANSKEIVTNVVSSMVDARSIDFHELHSEFETSSQDISNLIESWKRKIIEEGSITNYKRPKSESIATSKENVHPNVGPENHTEFQKKEEVGPGRDEEEEELDVGSMKVAELRKYLRDRQLDDQGLKKMLQVRLQRDIDEKRLKEAPKKPIASDEAVEEEPISSEEVVDSDVEEVAREFVDNEEDDVDMSESQNVEESKDGSVGDIGRASNASGDVSMTEATSSDHDFMESNKIKENEVAEEEPEPDVEDLDEVQIIENVPEVVHDKPTKSPKKTLGKKLLKATSNLFSPSKNKKSPKKAAKKLESAMRQERNVNSNLIDQVLEETVAMSKTFPTPSESAQTKRGSIAYDKSTVEIAGETNPLASTVQHNSTIESKEPPPMSAPVVPTKIAGKPFSSSTAQAKKREMDEARKARLEKIRNKVYKNQESAIKPHPTSAMKQSSSSTSSHDSAEDRKKAFAAKMRQKLATGKSHEVAATPTQQNPIASAQQQKQMKSPMDTYEMSDREESDSGSSSDEEDRSSNKKIPKWAQKEKLYKALEIQFTDGPGKLDPDKIFPEVSTCNLEAIFGQKKKRYVKRASTGDWRADNVSLAEKIVYKRNMGFK